MQKPSFSLLAAAFASAMLLWEGPLALSAAQEAFQNWQANFLPAMLPFFLLMPFLTGPYARNTFEQWFGKALSTLFGLSGACAGAICTGWIAGSPAGANASALSTRESSAAEQQRCAFIASGMSPAFFVNVIGQALDSIQSGWLLLACHLSALFLGGILLRRFTPLETSPSRPWAVFPPEPESDIFLAALRKLAKVLVWMVIFSIVSRVVSKYAHGLLPDWFFPALFEISGGVRAIAVSSLSLEAKLYALAAATGFGGICVLMQCVQITRVPMRAMFLAKAMHGCLSCMFLYLYNHLPPLWPAAQADPFSFCSASCALLALGASLFPLIHKWKTPEQH